MVGPQRDREAVTHVDAGLHPRLKGSDRAVTFGEPPRDLDFELGACLMRYMRDSSESVTRQQPYSEPVRIVKNDRVIDPQVKRRGRGPTRRHRTRNL